MNALNTYKNQLEEEAESKDLLFWKKYKIFLFSNKMLDQPQIFNFEPQETSFQNTPVEENLNIGVSNTLDNQKTQTPSSGSKPLSTLFNKFTRKDNNRPKSPFKFMNKSLREGSPAVSNNKNNKAAAKSKVARSSEFGHKFLPTAPANTASNLKSNVQGASPTTRQTSAGVNFYNNKDNVKRSMIPEGEPGFSSTSSPDVANRMLETDDMELQAIMDYVDEYYYGIRVFPGQDPSNIYVGWTTSRFHSSSSKINKQFNLKATSQCALINTNSDGSIVSNLTRKDCYMLSAAELNQFHIDSDVSSSKRISHGLLIGCLVDLSTGILSFLVNGKEAPQKFFVEPGTKLYPACFVEPTTKEVLQFELGRVKNCLPLSAALFPSLGKHVIPRCPLRLQVQSMIPKRWSRVPNNLLKVHTLKMNNVLGWSLLCEENGIILYFYIYEDNYIFCII